ncbi:MAG TPA: YcnI family protein [Caulobacteraceae bacterium]|nr:YcnI family protein [Caulobacteraceae bacterium]
MKRSIFAIAGVLGLTVVSQAQAHVTLSQTTAPSGSSFIAFFRVTHGCAGWGTTSLRIDLPADVLDAKPQPKPGWSLKVERAGGPSDGDEQGRVIAITWSGGPLDDTQWDEFGLSARLPKRTGVVAFPVVQTCQQGEARWTEVPTPGQTAHLSHPAPTVTLGPAGGGMDMSMPMPMGH